MQPSVLKILEKTWQIVQVIGKCARIRQIFRTANGQQTTTQNVRVYLSTVSD